MSKLYDKALEIATKAHKGQKRWNGDPYITHPVAVSKLIVIPEGEAAPLPSSCMIAVALLHDVLEDTEVTRGEIYDAIRDHVGTLACQCVLAAINKLTRNGNVPYAEYIQHIANDAWCRPVKIADLKHNLSDLKPGQRRDKYELAMMYLESV